MLSAKMETALNSQVNKELHSAYIYLGMANYLESQNFKGMASWMKKQASEEVEHAEKIIGYLQDRGAHVELEAIDKPRNEYESILNAFESGLAHERVVTESIHDLVILARDEKDLATENFLTWFVSEQVEEEATFSYVVDLLMKVNNVAAGLMIIDGQLGARA